MTLIELAKEIQSIESKYTNKSYFRVSVTLTQDFIPKYTVEHTTETYSTVNIGYGTTDVKELLVKFEMAMAANYRFVNDKNNNKITDITL